MSVDGICAASGLTLYYSNEAALVKKMIESSSKVSVTADSSKIGKNVFARVSDVRKTDILVTTVSDNREELSAISKLGVEIYEA